MRLIKLAGLNVDVTVGAMETNYHAVLSAALKAAKENATIVATSEMVLCGYPAEDLVHWQGFVDLQWQYLKRFAADTKAFDSVFVFGLAVFYDDAVYNCAAVVNNGRILGIVPKEKLPTYGVFYDMRTFARGFPGMYGEIEGIAFGDLIFEFPFGKMEVEICEDCWSPDGPMKRRAYAGAEVAISINGSPWRAGVIGTRREMLATRSSDNYCTLLYVNGIGGMDALVLDGGGFVFQNGQKIFEAVRWTEGVWTQVVDLDRTRLSRSANTTRRIDAEEARRSGMPQPRLISFSGSGPAANHPSYKYPIPSQKSFMIPSLAEGPVLTPREEYFEELIEAMVLGYKGYFEKSRVFKSTLIALSGGRDSALTLLLVYLYAEKRYKNLPHKKDWIRNFIKCVSMPSRFNSTITKSIARDLCEELGVQFEERPIQEAFERELAELRAQLGGVEPSGIAVQNIMPRIRMTRMQNLSNADGSLLVHCGNMTEKALGYGTVGGDFTAGAYSLLGNLPKTVVRALIAHLRKTRHNLASLDSLIASEESAELADDQRDEDDIGSIEVLDACIQLFYGEKLMPHEVYGIVRNMWSDDDLARVYPGYTKGLLKKWVKGFVKMSYNTTFKWVVSPPAIHLGSLDLERERAIQMPIVKSMEWLNGSLAAIDALPD